MQQCRITVLIFNLISLCLIGIELNIKAFIDERIECIRINNNRSARKKEGPASRKSEFPNQRIFRTRNVRHRPKSLCYRIIIISKSSKRQIQLSVLLTFSHHHSD